MDDTYQTLEFKDIKEFRNWLNENHKNVNGVWVKLHKKGSGLPSVTIAETLDTALCYGWIDGQRRSFDENSYLQKYTPRRARSLWSKRNVEYIARLTEAGLMMPAGLKEVERAQADGRWAAAYDGPSIMTFPESFLEELHKHPEAEARFNALSKTERYSMGWQLQTARTQKTVEARQMRIIQSLEADEI